MNNTGDTITSDSSSLALVNTTFFAGSGSSLNLQLSSAKIDNCQFINNSAGVNGAAVAAMGTYYEILPLVFSNSIFKDNHANKSGGALFIAGAGVVIVNCQFEQNSAESGGALTIVHGRADFISILSSFFVSNEAETEGGAITVSIMVTSILKVAIQFQTLQ